MPITKARTVAFLDIGSNSIRLLLARLAPETPPTILMRLKQTVRLGEGAFAPHHLQPSAIERAVVVVRQFADLARAHDADDILAVATAATREAANQDLFVQRLQQEAQLDVRVISGTEEARLIYLGVASGLHLGDKQACCIDIGGGSTEVIVGTQQQHVYLSSLRLGAIRLAMEFPEVMRGPVAPQTYSALQHYVRNHASRTIQEIRAYRLDLAVGSSGTIENLVQIAAQHYLKRPWQRDDLFTHGQLKQVSSMLAALSLEERRHVPGINPERADIIIAGAAILNTLMEALALRELRVTERGLREGLLEDYLSKHGERTLLSATSVRARSVLHLGQTCRFNAVHARTTARLALALFDSARAAGFHQMGAWERELLEYTALLHHIGAFLTHTNYQEHTYYLISHAELLGFDQKELAIMATTALYHRKSLPRKKHAVFAALDARSQEMVRVLSMLLRLAENLDRGYTGMVQEARLSRLGTRQALLALEATHDCQVELWGLQKQADAFHKVFGLLLIMQVVQTPPAPGAPLEGAVPVPSCVQG